MNQNWKNAKKLIINLDNFCTSKYYFWSCEGIVGVFLCRHILIAKSFLEMKMSQRNPLICFVRR